MGTTQLIGKEYEEVEPISHVRGLQILEELTPSASWPPVSGLGGVSPDNSYTTASTVDGGGRAFGLNTGAVSIVDRF